MQTRITQLMGALSLGAEAVYMGTRFMATKECPTHQNIKEAEAIIEKLNAMREGENS
jgi:NAD(P)H-dependent flavin oxidoreductase YrpB (nitropropane dioxygenase family)